MNRGDNSTTMAAATRTTGRFAIIAVLLLALPGAVFAQADNTLSIEADSDTRATLREAETLIAAQRSEDAWSLLSPLEATLAGNAYFDYLLGVSALDTGRRGNAIFALQRSLAVEPRFSGAKMELARAHFEIGDFAQARPLFVALLGENPPPSVRGVLGRYIDAIDRVPPTPAPRFTPFVELTSGDDSNANGSTADEQFLGFTLNPENVEADSPFLEGAAGFNWVVPSNVNQTWYTSGRFSHRRNEDATFVDATIGSLTSGMTWRRGEFFGHIGGEGYVAHRDDEPNQRYLGVDLGLGRQLSDQWAVSLGLRSGEVNHYESTLKALDVDRLLYTIGLDYRLSALTEFGFDLIGGRDTEDLDASPYGNSKVGARLSFTTGRGNMFLFGSLGTLTTDYDGQFFGAPREDDQLTAILAIEFRDVGFEGLSILPSLRYVDNESDVALYDYDRNEIGVTIRWMPQ